MALTLYPLLMIYQIDDLRLEYDILEATLISKGAHSKDVIIQLREDSVDHDLSQLAIHKLRISAKLKISNHACDSVD